MFKRVAMALLMALFLWHVCCVSQRTPIGLPCRDAGDCWRHSIRRYHCKAGKCAASPTSPPRPEATPE